METSKKKIDILEHIIAAVAGAYYNINLTRNLVPGQMYQAVDGKEYKFKNEPMSDMRELLEPPTREWRHMSLAAIADRADRSCGMQSVSYFPMDEFGEPDRSTWEPRRNNWNQ